MSPAQVQGYAAMALGQPLQPLTYRAPRLGEDDVRVSVSHCGVCFTDIHAIDDYYGITTFPFVPGHEVVGYVEARGRKVSGLEEGDRVGIGWQGRSCMRCEWCVQGEEQLCQAIAEMGTWERHGGFASSVTVDGRFAYSLPPAMPSEVAAVLMCAGISVYSPLRTHATGAGQKLGILGVGGLGHLAIQFAHALGYEVTALSSSPAKEREAIAFGADHFVVIGDPVAMKQVEYAFDLLLSTVHGDIDWGSILWTLKKRGRLVLVGFPRVRIHPADIVVHELSISGSFIGNHATMREMLSFAQAQGVTPRVEQMAMADVNAAIRSVRENRPRYRIVLTNDTGARIKTPGES